MRVLKTLCALALCALAPLAAAQGGAFPSKVIRLIVPWPPGGGIDVVARTVFQELPERIGQQVIVDNRAGANGFIGTTAVAKAEPDGYTLLFADVGSISISPAMRADTPYDSIKDFAPVSQVVSSPFTLVVHPKVPAKSLQELVAYAKAHPGKLTYGSFGNGSIAHLSGAMLIGMVPGLDIVHVPYKGAPPAITDLLAGQIDMLFLTVSSAAPHVEAGRLRALGVTTLKRSPVLPSVPAINEIYPGFEVNSWYGVLAPAGTPKEVIERLEKEIVAVVHLPKVQQALSARGFTPEGTSAQQFAAMIRQDVAQWAKVVKAAGLQDTGK